jgi:hypothetical protein
VTERTLRGNDRATTSHCCSSLSTEVVWFYNPYQRLTEQPSPSITYRVPIICIPAGPPHARTNLTCLIQMSSFMPILFSLFSSFDDYLITAYLIKTYPSTISTPSFDPSNPSSSLVGTSTLSTPSGAVEYLTPVVLPSSTPSTSQLYLLTNPPTGPPPSPSVPISSIYRSKLTLDNKVLIYNSIIKPMWTYGIEIWGTT